MNKPTRIDASIKNAVIHNFRNRKHNNLNQKKIARLCGISERSVKRILDEAGLATAVPLIKGEARAALDALKAVNLEPGQVRPLFAALDFVKIHISKEGPEKVTIMVPRPDPTAAQIIKIMSELAPDVYAETISKVVEARVAKKYNVGVQTAMLNISNAVDKNAKQ